MPTPMPIASEAAAGAREPFADPAQQREAASAAMWVFLSTEVMLFGGVFAAYLWYRHADPAAFARGSALLDAPLGAANTAVLLTSSLAMALAVRAAALGRRRPALGWLAGTALLGLAFLAIKLLSWRHEWTRGLVPALHAGASLAARPRIELFFVIYFIATGLHALHVLAGVGALTVTGAALARVRAPERWNPIELAGLYGHVVDIVWVFLFPILDLVR